MFKKTHDVAKLKAKIASEEEAQRGLKADLRKTQRELSAHDKIPSKERKENWLRDRWTLGDGIGSLLSSVFSGKEDLTKLYMARASLRGRLHCAKTITHHSNGTKTVETWDLEKQAKAVEGLLDDYKLDEQADAKPAA